MMKPTFWRLEYSTRSATLERGLQVRTGDPLWMMCRQWQVGEFQGEDAASPVYVTANYRYAEVNDFRGESQKAMRRMPDGPPLEAIAERETITGGAAAVRLAAEAGMYFMRLLDAHGVSGFRQEARQRFPLKYDGPPDRVMALLVRTAPDGRVIYAERQRLASSFGSGSTAAKLNAALTDYTNWYESRFLEPEDADEDGAWSSEYMAYRFAVGAALPDGSIGLNAEYHGGHLDWYAFDVGGKDRATTSAQMKTRQLTMLPARVRYAGMPSNRWWSFEDGEVNFAGLEAAGGDIARLVVAEFATVFGDDWYLLPLHVRSGALVQVTGLSVHNSFGGDFDVDSTAYSDAKTYPQRPWRFFELAGDPFADRPQPGVGPLLFVPRVTANRLRGPVRESISFIRDEAANMGWAIEAQRVGAHGRIIDRRSQWEQPPPADAPLDGTWRYRLTTGVPPYFIPFVPERQSADGSMRLRRARMIEWEQMPRDLVGPQGRILMPDRPLTVHEETLPRGGAQVRQRAEMARGADGRLYVWMGRHRRPGTGERSAGRFTDVLEVPAEQSSET